MALLSERSDPVKRPWVDPSIKNSLEPGQDFEKSIRFVRKKGYAVRRYKNREVSLGVSVGRRSSGQPTIGGISISHTHLDPKYLDEFASRLKEAAFSIIADMEKEQSAASFSE